MLFPSPVALERMPNRMMHLPWAENAQRLFGDGVMVAQQILILLV